jgi:hypothetical protein
MGLRRLLVSLSMSVKREVSAASIASPARVGDRYHHIRAWQGWLCVAVVMDLGFTSMKDHASSDDVGGAKPRRSTARSDVRQPLGTIATAAPIRQRRDRWRHHRVILDFRRRGKADRQRRCRIVQPPISRKCLNVP